MPRSRNSSFSLRQLMSTLTANRTIRWPDKDGTLAIENAKTEAIEALTGTGVLKSTGPGTAALLPTGAVGEAVLASGSASASRDILLAEVRSDNYIKGNYQITVGGTATDERWLFLPVAYDIYNRIVCSRGYNDDYFGGGALSLLIECTTGAWGSSGTGSYLRVVKANEYSWPGAFTGATFHLWREIRLLESAGAELGYSGIWLRVMGNRTYTFSGLAGPPVDHPTYTPTIGTPLAVTLPAGIGEWYTGSGSYYTPYLGVSFEKVSANDLTFNKLSSVVTTESTSTTTGPLQLPGIGMGNGRIWLSKGLGLDNFDPASQPTRSLGAFGGNLYYKGTTGAPAYLNPLSLAAPVPVSNVITVPFNAGQTTLAAYTVSTPLAFTPASTRVVGGVTNVPVIANGVNVPTLTGITMLAGSASYSNIAGTRNVYQFMDDGSTVWCQILRASTPALTGLTPIGVNFSVQGSNFTTPSAGTYSSSSTTAFSGSAGSAVSVPAGKDFVLTASATSTTVIGLHNNNTTASVPGTTQNWLYYTWNAAGTLFTAEGSTTYNSGVSVPLTARFFQLRRVGSQITIYSRALVTDAWTLIGTMPTPSTTALFVMLGTTSGQTVSGITLEVAQ